MEAGGHKCIFEYVKFLQDVSIQICIERYSEEQPDIITASKIGEIDGKFFVYSPVKELFAYDLKDIKCISLKPIK